MLAELNAWSADELRHSAPDTWNALQVLEHVMVSEFGTLGYLKKKTSAPVDTLEMVGEAHTASGDQLSAALQSTRQWKAPDVLPGPTGADDLATATAKWHALHAEFAAFLGQLPDAYADRVVFRHPFAGMLGLEQTLVFLRDHIIHHMHQLQRIKAGRA